MRNPLDRRRRLRAIARRVRRHSFTRFAAFGLLGLGVDVALLWLLVAVTPLPATAAVTVAFLATYAMNFALNRRFAFGAHGPLAGHVARFAPQLAVDWILVVGAVEALTTLGLPLLPARVLAAGTNAVFNYAGYRWWTFGSAGTDPSVRAGDR